MNEDLIIRTLVPVEALRGLDARYLQLSDVNTPLFPLRLAMRAHTSLGESELPTLTTIYSVFEMEEPGFH